MFIEEPVQDILTFGPGPRQIGHQSPLLIPNKVLSYPKLTQCDICKVDIVYLGSIPNPSFPSFVILDILLFSTFFLFRITLSFTFQIESDDTFLVSEGSFK